MMMMMGEGEASPARKTCSPQGGTPCGKALLQGVLTLQPQPNR